MHVRFRPLLERERAADDSDDWCAVAFLHPWRPCMCPFVCPCVHALSFVRLLARLSVRPSVCPVSMRVHGRYELLDDAQVVLEQARTHTRKRANTHACIHAPTPPTPHTPHADMNTHHAGTRTHTHTHMHARAHTHTSSGRTHTTPSHHSTIALHATHPTACIATICMLARTHARTPHAARRTHTRMHTCMHTRVCDGHGALGEVWPVLDCARS